MSVRVPRSLLEEARRRGIDVESLLVSALARILGLDPQEEAWAHLELAREFLEEGAKMLEEGDPVQASGKLYKAAEESLKAAALLLGLKEVVGGVKSRGRWTVTDLERVARALSRKVRRARGWWDAANYLHVWGFHEAKLDVDAVRERLGDIRSLVEAVRRLAESSGGGGGA